VLAQRQRGRQVLLDRDVAAKRDVTRSVGDAERALADNGPQFVAAEDRAHGQAATYVLARLRAGWVEIGQSNPPSSRHAGQCQRAVVCATSLTHRAARTNGGAVILPRHRMSTYRNATCKRRKVGTRHSNIWRIDRDFDAHGTGILRASQDAASRADSIDQLQIQIEGKAWQQPRAANVGASIGAAPQSIR